MADDVGNTENEVEALPPPILKKRSTKRGLAKSLSSSTAASESENADALDVYSSCVARCASLTHIQPARVPLNMKNQDSQKAATKVTAPAEPDTTDRVEEDDLEVELIGIENDHSDKDAGDGRDAYRSPSPPAPPPMVKQARRSRPMKRGMKKAFDALGWARGELQACSVLPTSPVVIIDKSPERKLETIVVRVKHIDQVHRFSMEKIDIFYSLQSQMANLLGTEADYVGLYLRDTRLKPTDTPLSINLHLADIIECHKLVPAAGDGSLEGQEKSDETAQVLMQCINKRDNLQLVVKKHLSFKILMEDYAKQSGKLLETLRFKLDGELLTPDMLPLDVDLEDGDTIDVVEVR